MLCVRDAVIFFLERTIMAEGNQKVTDAEIAQIESDTTEAIAVRVDDVIETVVGGEVGDVLGDFVGDAAGQGVALALREVRGKLGDTVISPGSFMLLVRYVMEVVEGKPIKGKAQKDLALDILNLFIDESDFAEADKEMCRTLVTSGAAGDTIDLIVDATQGNINVNAAASVAVGCLGTCIARWFGKRTKGRRS